MLGVNPGGKWNERRFDLVGLLVMVKLAQYDIQPIIILGVGLDSKNSNQRILQVST